MKVSRRGVLAGALAGGGLAVAFVLMPQRFGAPIEPTEGEVGFNAWLKSTKMNIVYIGVVSNHISHVVVTCIKRTKHQVL